MYKRVLLKLSGESLRQEEESQIIDVDYLKETALTIKSLYDQGLEIALVIGAGNIWRGKLADQIGIERIPADYMGMLGTVINAVAISSALKNLDCPSVVFSSISPIEGVTRAYNPKEAIEELEKGNVIFLAGGTGKPLLTTDTAAAELAIDTKVDAILMAKNDVDGVYSDDPDKNPDAIFYKRITYQEMIDKDLKVMDRQALEMLKDKDIEVRVFNMADISNFVKVAKGEDIGTTITKGDK
ncbi:MAG: UMP kinase [Coprobacillus sp.]|nr:UMP kinase [Coprobacillus sp.]